MRTLVGVESGSQREAFTTKVALVRPLTSMPVNVRLQVALLIEAFATVLTLVHAHIGVGPHVIRQVCQLLEAPPTFLTLVWFLASVRVAMDLHVNLLMESFAAEVTDEWLVVGVRAHVSMQVGRTIERLVALRAHVRFDGRVGEAMTCQVAGLSEGAAALLALEGFIARVYALVRGKRVRAAERLATHVARVAILLAFHVVQTLGGDSFPCRLHRNINVAIGTGTGTCFAD